MKLIRNIQSPVVLSPGGYRRLCVRMNGTGLVVSRISGSTRLGAKNAVLAGGHRCRNICGGQHLLLFMMTSIGPVEATCLPDVSFWTRQQDDQSGEHMVLWLAIVPHLTPEVFLLMQEW
mmetsp:Transcript_158330/g.303841  ORF Transcript_158330/g.303841 Transcript_158330/m.303841 type:complete len:119 (+) Transcript_158330:392-748(+)